MRGIWHLFSIYCNRQTWLLTRIWLITGTTFGSPTRDGSQTCFYFISSCPTAALIVRHAFLSQLFSQTAFASIWFTHILITEGCFGIIKSVEKQVYLVKLTLEYSIKWEQRNWHLDNRFLQTLANWLQEQINAMSVSNMAQCLRTGWLLFSKIK